MAVMLDVRLGSFRGVMRGMMKMPLRRMSVVGGRFVVPSFVMLGRFAMMLCRVVVMLRRFGVVLRCLLGHMSSLVRSGQTDAGRLPGDDESCMTLR
jgi:hypothetical protein